MAKERSADGSAAGLLDGRRTVGAGARGGRVQNRRVRAFAVVGSLALAAIVAPGGVALADKVGDAKAKLLKLNSQIDHLDNQFNKADGDWKAAKAQLTAMNKSVSAEQALFNRLHQRVAQMAAAAYKSGNSDSVASLAAAKDPQAVLDQVSIFSELTKNRSDALTEYVASAQRLQREQAQDQQATSDLQQKKVQLDQQRRQIKSVIAQQQKLVDQLGGNAGTTGNSNTNSGSHGQTYAGPATGSARAAVAYAYAQLGAPYVYGGTGPYSAGFDCSGLAEKAWQAGGVNLPRVVPDQYAATRRVTQSELQPGDLVFMDSLNHVGIFVGNGEIIHAPQPGQDVSFIRLDNVWVQSHLTGFGRP